MKQRKKKKKRYFVALSVFCKQNYKHPNTMADQIQSVQSGKWNRHSRCLLLPLPPLPCSQVPISWSCGQQNNSEIRLNRRSILHSCLEGCWRLVMKDECHYCNASASTLVVIALPIQELSGAKPFWFISQMKSQRNSLCQMEE